MQWTIAIGVMLQSSIARKYRSRNVALFAVLLFAIGSSLGAKPVWKEKTWKGFTLQIAADEKAEFPKQLLTIKGKGKILFTKTFDLTTMNFRKDAKGSEQDFLMLEGYSGGESGCCNHFVFLYKDASGFNTFDVEQSAYDTFEIVDINEDGINEIKTLDSSHYASYLEFTEKETRCSFIPAHVFVDGFGDTVFPSYAKIEKKQGIYQLVSLLPSEISSANKAKLLQPYISKAENSLIQNKNKVYKSGEHVSAYFQYYDWMIRLDRRKDAESKIKDSGIQLEFNCSDGKTRNKSLEESLSLTAKDSSG